LLKYLILICDKLSFLKSNNININVKRKLNFTLGCSKAGIVDFKRDPLFSHLTPSDIRTIVKSPLRQINEPLKPCRFKPL